MDAWDNGGSKMSKKVKYFIMLAISLVALGSCSGEITDPTTDTSSSTNTSTDDYSSNTDTTPVEKNCDNEMAALKLQKGEPDDIDKYDTSSGYHSYTYWYWCEGFSRDFTWGGPVTGCETSDYTTTPLSSCKTK